MDRSKKAHVCKSDFLEVLDSGDMEYVEGLTWNKQENNFDGCGLQGYIETTYQDIVRVFGEPSFGPNDLVDKVTCQWDLMFNDGTSGYIYDYKEYVQTPLGVYNWHIGRASKKIVSRVNQAFEIVNK